MNLNLSVYRVECPVCRRRRPLHADENADLINYKTYEYLKFCSTSCNDRATIDQLERVRDNKLSSQLKALNTKLQN